ncbi:type II toxin-antitoxin system VapC family toxin [Candidatus Gottesmanbacteria bacterium]|nr:type II toxin-antitoxin system VapC family toxin [Candidatus Gottesmanbacteria bacterium]
MILLDTHVLIWYVNSPDKLSEKSSKKINLEIKNKNDILISSITVWEIYMLVKKGRLKLSLDVDTWIEKVEKLSFLQFVPVNNKIAAKSVILPGSFHKDPADRIIVSTALQNGATLITSDRRILKYSPLQSLW